MLPPVGIWIDIVCERFIPLLFSLPLALAYFLSNIYECSLRTGKFYKKSYFGGDFDFLKRSDA